MDDISVPIHAKEQKKSGNFWIGNAGQITPVHYDFSTGDPGMDGIHALVVGRKIFKLFDPQKNEKCFTRKTNWGRFHQAVVDGDNGLPDPKKQTNFSNAKYVEIDLKAGEALFIPKNWWHHVHTVEPRHARFLISCYVLSIVTVLVLVVVFRNSDLNRIYFGFFGFSFDLLNIFPLLALLLIFGSNIWEVNC